MTFNRGSRISVFSTSFHYESKSIYDQNLLMGSNCTLFLCVSLVDSQILKESGSVEQDEILVDV